MQKWIENTAPRKQYVTNWNHRSQAPLCHHRDVSPFPALDSFKTSWPERRWCWPRFRELARGIHRCEADACQET